MKLFGWLIPWWAYAIAGALYSSGMFYAGFQVESWRWSASELHTVKQQIKQVDHQVAKIHTESTTYEQHRTAALAANDARQAQIRTIYRDVSVAADCAAPASVRSVLDDGIAAANARARGEPGAAVPGAADAASGTYRP